MELNHSPHVMGRLASLGLALVILLLAAVSLWSSYATETVAGNVSLSAKESRLYTQMRSQLAAARSDQLAYRIQDGPHPELRAHFDAAIDGVRSCLLGVLAMAGKEDRADATLLLRLVSQYRTLSRNYFTAVDQGNEGRAVGIESAYLGGLVGQMTLRSGLAERRERGRAMAAVLSESGSVDAIRTAVAVCITLGLALLACFAWLFRIYQRRVQAEERKHRTLVEQLPVAAYLGPLDHRGAMTYVGREIEAILGYSRREWMESGELWASLVHPEDRDRVLDEYRRAIVGGGRFLSEYRMLARDGRTVWVRDEAVIVAEGLRGAPARHGVLSDITDRKLTAQVLEHQALHDALTNLPNRTLLFDRLQQALVAARRDRTSIALLVMDLDRFKEVNDTFGHQCGDRLLEEVGERLRATLGEGDTIARLGGDEFAVLLPGADAAGATTAAERIQRALDDAFVIDGHCLDIGISIGAAMYPQHGIDATLLLQRADVAMYSAKDGDAPCAVYEPDQDPYSPARLALIGDLRAAIEHDDLTLYYQPKAHFRTPCAAHVEALARWEHPEHGFVPPDRFIPLAEHAGLINALSMWVLNAALRQCREWHEQGFDVSVAVNLSPRSLHEPGLVRSITDTLHRWDASPEWLQLEITEGALMVDPSRAMETLGSLHAMGICIAIDDFGTGYSSLGYLKRLPADQIKIDKSFVQDMARSEDDYFIVRSVIDLGHSLGLEVVAEGVEDQATWDMLSGMGCDLAQGYHLSRPLAPTDLTGWLQHPRLPLPAVS